MRSGAWRRGRSSSMQYAACSMQHAAVSSAAPVAHARQLQVEPYCSRMKSSCFDTVGREKSGWCECAVGTVNVAGMLDARIVQHVCLLKRPFMCSAPMVPSLSPFVLELNMIYVICNWCTPCLGRRRPHSVYHQGDQDWTPKLSGLGFYYR